MYSDSFSIENPVMLLRPSVINDVDDIWKIANPNIWNHSTTSIDSWKDAKEYISLAIRDRAIKKRQQLTIVDKIKHGVIGCSSYENYSKEDRRIEIGWTWLGKQFQGKNYNRIAKYLMLKYAFETYNIFRVEFRARGTNLQSQKALQNIGATCEATLRSYIESDGMRHDFVCYSILLSEWPAIKREIFPDLMNAE